MKTTINTTLLSIAIILFTIFPLNSLKSETGKFICYDDDWENFISMVDLGDYLLLGTFSEGIYKFNKTTGTTEKMPGADSLTKYVNTDMKIDKDNKVWGLSYYSGLFEFDGENLVHYNIPDTELKYYWLTCLIIDEYNNKWVGSKNNGLFKFDGTQWEKFDTTNSDIPYNEIRCIEKDVNGNIWIGTDVGLIMFDGTNFTHFNIENSGLLSNVVRSIAFDSENQLWIGTSKGLVKFDGNEWLTYADDYIAALVADINKIYIDNDKVYIGSEFGLVVYDNNNWIEYNRSNSGLSDNSVIRIITDVTGNIWISTSIDGLIKFDGATWSNFQILKQNYGLSRDAQIVEDKNGIIWVKASSAVYSFDGNYWKKYTHSNSDLPVIDEYYFHSETLSSIAVDSNNNIWVASSKYGLSKFDGTKWINYTTNNSELTSDKIAFLYVTKDNNLIVKTDISTMLYDGIAFQSTDMLGKRIAYDNKGVLWNIDSPPNVLWYYEDDNGIKVPKSFYPPDNQNSDLDLELIDLVIDSKNNIWIASTWGLLKFDGTNWTTFDFSDLGLDLHYSFVQAITIDKNDVLWMVVEFGYLFRFDGVNWTVYEPFIPAMFEPNYVTSLMVDTKGNLWIGTSWTGVFVFNEVEIILNPADVIETFVQNDYKIFPNPVEDFININGLENDNFEYHIFDLSMKQVSHSFGVSNQLNVSNLNSGVYYLVIKEKSKLQAMKFIKR